MFYHERRTSFVRSMGSGLLRYILRSLICVLRDLSYLVVSFLHSSLHPLAVFDRLILISRLSAPWPFPERIVERLKESASRSRARETNETRGNRLCYSVAPPSCFPSSIPRPYYISMR